jgi:hypothetical protein
LHAVVYLTRGEFRVHQGECLSDDGEAIEFLRFGVLDIEIG